MNELAGEFEGLSIEEARKAITEKLKEDGYIFKQEDLAAESRIVNTHERCGTPVEYIPTKQWFIKVVEKKEELLKQGEKVNWYPSYMGKRYRDWVENLGWDWAISRQRYFGVPIPVWYAPDGTVVPASPEQLPVDPQVDKPLDCKGYDPENTHPRERRSRYLGNFFHHSATQRSLGRRRRRSKPPSDVHAPTGTRHHPYLGFLHSCEVLLPLQRCTVDRRCNFRSRDQARSAS